MEDLLATATIGTAYGLKGEVKLFPNNPDARYLKKLKHGVLQLPNGGQRQVDIETMRTVGGQLLVKFTGIDSPEEARLVARSALLVAKEDAYPLKKGEVYLADLVGCKLIYEGAVLASVKDILEGSQSPMLEAETADGKVYLVPFMDPYVSKVDIPNKEISLAVDWILS